MQGKVLLILALNVCLASAWFWTTTPDGPNEVREKVRLNFSPDGVRVVEFPLKQLPELFYDKDFNASRPMAIYIHGWMSGTVAYEPSILAMRSAYAGYNFVAIDWKAYSVDISYFSKVIPQLKIVSLSEKSRAKWNWRNILVDCRNNRRLFATFPWKWLRHRTTSSFRTQFGVRTMKNSLKNANNFSNLVAKLLEKLVVNWKEFRTENSNFLWSLLWILQESETLLIRWWIKLKVFELFRSWIWVKTHRRFRADFQHRREIRSSYSQLSFPRNALSTWNNRFLSQRWH